MPDFPLISVVVCTYNGAPFLRQQLDSILSQTYKNLEVIISDDASTDNTTDILRDYEAESRMKVFYNSVNKGYVSNFETALLNTTGSYIACSDQDDIWLPEKIETLYNCFNNELLVFSDSELVDDKGKSLHKKLSDLRNMYSGRDMKGFFLSNVVWGHALMMKRELLNYALPIPSGTPHDIWLAVKAASHSGIRYCDRILTYYRQHSDTYTQTLKPGKISQRSQNVKYEEYLKQSAWLDLLKQNAEDGDKEFFEQLSRLFRTKERGKFSFSLFWYLLKHQHSLYQFSKKNLLSRIVDIRKLSRGVSP